MKTIIHGSILGMFAILLCTSCSKKQEQEQPQQQGQEAQKTPAVTYQAKPDPNKVFSVQRFGNTAKIQINADFSDYVAITILRSPTGQSNKKFKVAKLTPQTKQFEDTLASPKPYWYWLRATPKNGDSTMFGPIQATPDESKTTAYTQAPNNYPWTVARTDTAATVTWDFPDEKYQKIWIYRNTSTNPRKRVLAFKTLSWKDTLSDAGLVPDADYWYWMEIQIKDGAIIKLGPIKAEYNKD